MSRSKIYRLSTMCISLLILLSGCHLENMLDTQHTLYENKQFQCACVLSAYQGYWPTDQFSVHHHSGASDHSDVRDKWSGLQANLSRKECFLTECQRNILASVGQSLAPDCGRPLINWRLWCSIEDYSVRWITTTQWINIVASILREPGAPHTDIEDRN